jgi:hypothetical protein
MFDSFSKDWARIPEGLAGAGRKKDFNQFQDLDEGRIPVAVPMRVQSGRALPSGLVLETYNNVLTLLWDEVEFLALGWLVTEPGGGDAPKSRMRMAIREFLLGDPEKKIKTKPLSENCILDIYVRDGEHPFRVDQGTFNYRSFLFSPGYVSLENFRQVAATIAYFARSARLDKNLITFITRPREKTDKYWSLNDFVMDCQENRLKLLTLTHRSEVDIKPPPGLPDKEAAN